jgi:hypothetical protein
MMKLNDIWGPLLYVSGSTFTVDTESEIYNCTNDDYTNPLMQIDTSTVDI